MALNASVNEHDGDVVTVLITQSSIVENRQFFETNERVVLVPVESSDYSRNDITRSVTQVTPGFSNQGDNSFARHDHRNYFLLRR